MWKFNKFLGNKSSPTEINGNGNASIFLKDEKEEWESDRSG